MIEPTSYPRLAGAIQGKLHVASIYHHNLTKADLKVLMFLLSALQPRSLLPGAAEAGFTWQYSYIGQHQDIADSVELSRPQVSRSTRALSKAGLITQIGHGEILILSIR